MATPSAAAERLGHVALLPFVACAAAVWLADGDARGLALRALVAYAAVVCAFIGALHWGFGFVQPASPARRPGRGFVWGVVPSIVAWASLLVPPTAGLAVDAVLLAVCYAVDRSVYPAVGAAPWLPLRARLTLLAVASCIAGMVGAWVQHASAAGGGS